jgi:two-component system nitrate/nitrite response regulator NarL
VDEIRVLVVDDHSLFRKGVVQTIGGEADMTVAGEAETASAAIERAREMLPDLVLLDINLPDRSGLSVAKTLQRECPYSKIVILTVVEDEDAVLRALKEGAHGYVLKGVSAEELVQVIRSVYRGETYVTPSMAGRLLSELTAPNADRTARDPIGELTERERAILDLVAQGKTNKEIAAELFLSEKTVKHYMTNVLQKLQVRNRVEAALIAREKMSAS